MKKGEKRPLNVGRKKGTPNKPKECVAEICERMGFNPFEMFVNTAKMDHEALGYQSPLIHYAGKDGKIFSQERITLNHRLEAAAKLAPHIAPVLKAVELSGSLDTSDADMLEEARQRILLLENEKKTD